MTFLCEKIREIDRTVETAEWNLEVAYLFSRSHFFFFFYQFHLDSVEK